MLFYFLLLHFTRGKVNVLILHCIHVSCQVLSSFWYNVVAFGPRIMQLCSKNPYTLVFKIVLSDLDWHCHDDFSLIFLNLNSTVNRPMLSGIAEMRHFSWSLRSTGVLSIATIVFVFGFDSVRFSQLCILTVKLIVSGYVLTYWVVGSEFADGLGFCKFQLYVSFNVCLPCALLPCLCSWLVTWFVLLWPINSINVSLYAWKL